MKEQYRMTCDITDSNSKMIELMDRFTVFQESMDNDLAYYRSNYF